MSEHLILVDCSGFAYRAYYTKAPQYHQEHGTPTAAVEIYLSMVWNMLGRAQEDLPTMGVAVFDPPGVTWRHKVFPAYKANRDPARTKELKDQFPIMKACTPVLGLTVMERRTFEADDLIATLAWQARNKGIRVTIVSSDKDFAQLVENGRIEIVDPMQRRRYVEADVREKWGVDPIEMPVLQALAGDSVDGIPGLTGVGLATAAKLVRRFGKPADSNRVQRATLEAILRSHTEHHPPLLKHQLRTRAEDARLYLKLATLRRNVPGKIDFEKLRTRPIMLAELMAIAEKLGARGRVEALFGVNTQLERLVDKDKDALAWWREELIQKGQKITDDPQCGYFRIKQFAGGPWVAARIWREPACDPKTGEKTGDEILLCHVAGKPKDARQMWPRLSMGCITVKEHNDLMAGKQASHLPPEIVGGKKSFKDVPTPSFKKARKTA